jgi:hypothetical protein
MNITDIRIFNTSYDDGSCWMECRIDNKYSYEIFDSINDILDISLYTTAATAAAKKIDVNSLDNDLKYMIEECRCSEDDMFFMDYEDLEQDIDYIKDKVLELGLSDYITFEEYNVITVYGSVITKFLF